MNNHKDNHLGESVFTEKVNNLKSIYSSENNKIILSEMGQFDQGKINTMSNSVEFVLEQMGVEKRGIKKVFNILIETLQNIIIHGERNEQGVQITYCVVGKNKEGIHIHSGNLIQLSQADKIKSRLEAIKSLNLVDLKKEYMNVLTNGELSAKGGAGLGFLTIALKADNHIDYEIKNLNDNYSLFSLHSTVKN